MAHRHGRARAISIPPPISQSWLASSKERSNIGVQYVVHLGAGDADRQCIQRIVLAAPRSESIRGPEEILLVDRVQHRDCRPLDDLSSRAATASGR